MEKKGLINIASKLPQVGTTIFTTMSKLAQESGAINLGQGFPGFEMDASLGKLVGKYIQRGMNQYAPMPGLLELRTILSQKIEKSYGYVYDPESEITITAGATQAIFTAITALVHEGDEVIVFAPAYDCYAPAILLNGGKPIWIDLTYPEYRINWEHVKRRMSHKTRMIIINSPHNPTGTSMSDEDMLQLQKIVKDTEVIVLSDEVYEHILFDSRKHYSVACYPELARRSMSVYSFGKTFHTTGWKVGYICGAERLMNEFRKVHQYNVFSVNTPIQYALAEYMEDESTYLQLPQFYEHKRDVFLSALQDSRFSFQPAQGTYFQCLSYANFSDQKDLEFAHQLTVEHGVASIPCSAFYPDHMDEGVLRFCFAKDEDTLFKAGKLLSRL